MPRRGEVWLVDLGKARRSPARRNFQTNNGAHGVTHLTVKVFRP